MTGIRIVAYERKYREALLSLMFYSRHTHQHLDWYKIAQWLDLNRTIVRLAFDDSGLIGFLGMSEPLNGASWVRIAAMENYTDPERAFRFLWDAMRSELQTWDVRDVSILVMNQWIIGALSEEGFQHREDVVTLQRAGQDLPEINSPDIVVIDAYEAELPTIERIDHAAFSAPWQMSGDDLRQAQRQAASCTLALANDEPVGYQISTRHHTSGHLARLAVLPDAQGHGVGAALLHHLIDRFNRRGIRSVTVNTQVSNIRSQRLYERFGFHRNGFDLPVWAVQLDQPQDEGRTP